jgi:mevalonate kinase
VLLSGEHAVVHGYPALVASIDRFMTVRVEASSRFVLESEREDELGLVVHCLELVGVDPNSVKVSITSTIPARLGSSAALCAGVIKAAFLFQGRTLEDDEWFELTWDAEKRAHGNSSGVDPAAVIYTGLIWYVRDVERVNLKLAQQYRFLLVNSGKPVESAGEIIGMVGEKKEKEPESTTSLLDRIGEVTGLLRGELLTGGVVIDLINQNGLLLEELGVVGESAIDLSERLRKLKCGVKVTGAGGVKAGSGMLLVATDELDKIAAMVTSWGFEVFPVTIGGT